VYVYTARYSDGDEISYVFVPSITSAPKYVLIMMLGGHGTIGLKKNPDGTPFFSGTGKNFLVRTRGMFADNDVAVVVID